eukprot:TRINITY_DN8298_c0_g1_i1.p1 TRINITY_DN8298_c0_g1~~TRINITY_DN8298_c0_g1_i1.p1  ORF type:complete len:481 (+),score=86.44 TRINITY_DN8298_c0_g1_i1:109-1551(+)
MATSLSASASLPKARSFLVENHVPKKSNSVRIRIAIKIWLHIFSNALVPVCICSTILVLYYIPLHLLCAGSALDLYLEWEYVTRRVLGSATNYAIYVISVVHLFGAQIGTHYSIRIALPMFLVQSFIQGARILSPSLRTNLSILCSILTPCLLVYKIRASSKVLQEIKAHHEDQILCHDGTATALLKGWTALLGLIVLFQVLIPIYIEMDIWSQLVVKVIVFPIVSFAVHLTQQYFLVGLSLQHMPRRMIVTASVSQYNQFLERMLVSNISAGATSMVFVSMSAVTMLVQVSFRASILLRYRLFCRIRDYIHQLKKSTLPANRELASPELTDLRQDDFVDEAADSERTSEQNGDACIQGSTLPSEMSDYLKEMHARWLIESMMGEIRVLITVPLLMYLLYPLFPSSKFQTIASVSELFWKIFVQLIFEAVGDMLAIYYEINHLGIPLQMQDLQKQKLTILWVSVIVTSLFFTHGVIEQQS